MRNSLKVCINAHIYHKLGVLEVLLSFNKIYRYHIMTNTIIIDSELSYNIAENMTTKVIYFDKVLFR